MLILQARVKAILKTDDYSQSDEGYKVTSVYFDDYFDTHLEDSKDGTRQRNKFRIRIYNDSFDLIKLEVKYKYNNRVLKKSQIISYNEMIKLMQGDTIDDFENSTDSTRTLFNLAIQQDLLRPKTIVEYDRCAFLYNPGNTRITFDRNIRYSVDFEGFINNNCSYHDFLDENRVIEVKYDEYIPGVVLQLLESGNMVQTAFSKYKLSREFEELCQQKM